jgi:hypothetical protein
VKTDHNDVGIGVRTLERHASERDERSPRLEVTSFALR